MAVLTISKREFDKYAKEIREGTLSPKELGKIAEIFSKTPDPAGRTMSGRLLLDITLRCSESNQLPDVLAKTRQQLVDESLPALLRSEDAVVSNSIFGLVVAKVFGNGNAKPSQLKFMNDILSTAQEGAEGKIRSRIEEALGIGLKIEASAKRRIV